jgi:hypothetical protein
MRTTDKPFKITKKQVYEAYKAVESNHGAAGVDKETIEQFEADLKGNLYKLWKFFADMKISTPTPCARAMRSQPMSAVTRDVTRRINCLRHVRLAPVEMRKSISRNACESSRSADSTPIVPVASFNDDNSRAADPFILLTSAIDAGPEPDRRCMKSRRSPLAHRLRWVLLRMPPAPVAAKFGAGLTATRVLAAHLFNPQSFNAPRHRAGVCHFLTNFNQLAETIRAGGSNGWKIAFTVGGASCPGLKSFIAHKLNLLNVTSTLFEGKRKVPHVALRP